MGLIVSSEIKRLIVVVILWAHLIVVAGLVVIALVGITSLVGMIGVGIVVTVDDRLVVVLVLGRFLILVDQVHIGMWRGDNTCIWNGLSLHRIQLISTDKNNYGRNQQDHPAYTSSNAQPSARVSCKHASCAVIKGTALNITTCVREDGADVVATFTCEDSEDYSSDDREDGYSYCDLHPTGCGLLFRAWWLHPVNYNPIKNIEVKISDCVCSQFLRLLKKIIEQEDFSLFFCWGFGWKGGIVWAYFGDIKSGSKKCQDGKYNCIRYTKVSGLSNIVTTVSPDLLDITSFQIEDDKLVLQFQCLKMEISDVSKVPEILVLELLDALLQYSGRDVFLPTKRQFRLKPSLPLHIPLHFKLLPLQLDQLKLPTQLSLFHAHLALFGLPLIGLGIQLHFFGDQLQFLGLQLLHEFYPGLLPFFVAELEFLPLLLQFQPILFELHEFKAQLRLLLGVSSLFLLDFFEQGSLFSRELFLELSLFLVYFGLLVCYLLALSVQVVQASDLLLSELLFPGLQFCHQLLDVFLLLLGEFLEHSVLVGLQLPVFFVFGAFASKFFLGFFQSLEAFIELSVNQ